MTCLDVVMIVAELCRKRQQSYEKCWNNLEKIEEWR